MNSGVWQLPGNGGSDGRFPGNHAFMLTDDHIKSHWLAGINRLVSAWVMVWTCLVISPIHSLQAEIEEPPVEEFEAKAVLVYHFAKLTSWPEGTFKTDQSPILISVYGDKGFYEVLKKYDDRIVNGRALSVRYVEAIADAPHSQILYITGDMDSTVEYYLKKHSTPTLTVGESKDFVEQGGILAIVREKEHLTLYANLKSAVETKLYLNNNLVKLTKQVSAKSGEKDK